MKFFCIEEQKRNKWFGPVYDVTELIILTNYDTNYLV